MCGFVGGLLRRPVADDDLRHFQRSADTLAHRGPDDQVVTAVPAARAVLAFRRLSIIDLVSGRQPMSTPEGDHLVFNGEIYDYREHRRALSTAGETFQTVSDTEVLLRLLSIHGAKALTMVRGMFAIAYIDRRRGQLLLGRDRLGVKSLYFIDRPEGFFFASEPKALLALPWVTPELDEGRLADYFDRRSVPSPGTLFRGIERLHPGSVLTLSLDDRCGEGRQYWQLPAPRPNDAPMIPLSEAVDRVEAGLLRSVERRLVADVPVGAFLSGGLDSGLIVAAMRRLEHPEIRAFTAGFPGSRDDETAFAARVSRRFGVRQEVVPLQAEGFLDLLPRWVELNDDLVADASALPLLAVSDAARRAGCIVMLSGEGADELFAGYGSQHKHLLLRRLATQFQSAATRRGLVDLLVATGLAAPQDRPRLDAYFVREGGYLGVAALGDESEIGHILDPRLLGPNTFLRARGSSLAELCRFDLGPRISDDLLVRTDRATMGASIEARVPFLDHEFVEMVLGLPDRWRAMPGVGKIALRMLGKRWGLPARTLLHRKIGFQIPLGAWFRGALRPQWEMILAERAIPALRYDGVAALLRAHDRGAGDHAELLWRVFALERWYRRWIRGEGRRPERPRPRAWTREEVAA
jgi:asparagine synthase (glutamine-hydrolysing)